MRLVQPRTRHVREMSEAIIPINIHAGEITRHQQVQLAIRIQIHERRRIDSSKPFWAESSLNGCVTQISSAVIEVKMAWVSIVRVVIRRWHAATGVWQFVLPNEDIQIPVVINVTARDRPRSKKILLLADERAWHR